MNLNIEGIKNLPYYQIEKLDASYALLYLVLSLFLSSNPFVYGFVKKYGKLGLVGALSLHIYLSSLLMDPKEFIIAPEQIKQILGIAGLLFVGFELSIRFKDSIFNPYIKQDHLTPIRTRILKVIDISNLITIALEFYVVSQGNVFKVLVQPIFVLAWLFLQVYIFIFIRSMVRKGTQVNFKYIEVSRGLFYSALLAFCLSSFNISFIKEMILDFLKGIEVEHDPNHNYYTSNYFYLTILSQRIFWLTCDVYTPLKQAVENMILKSKKPEKPAEPSGEKIQDEKVVSEV